MRKSIILNDYAFNLYGPKLLNDRICVINYCGLEKDYLFVKYAN